MASPGDRPPLQPPSKQVPQPAIDSFNEYRNRGQIASSGDGLQVNVIGDHIHIAASSANSSPTPGEARAKKPVRRVFDYARKHMAKFIFAVAAGVCVAALATWLGLNAAGNSSISTNIIQTEPRPPISPYGSQTDVAFAVENTARAGVWALKSPVMTSFSGRGEPPPNAARWLANATIVRVRCARKGTAYELKLGGRLTRWRFFAELDNGTYMAMAGFAQTTEDGAQHLIPCEGT